MVNTAIDKIAMLITCKTGLKITAVKTSALIFHLQSKHQHYNI